MFDPLLEAMAAILSWFYDIDGSYGLSIILLTLSVMIVLTPLTIRGTKSMMAMQEHQPELKRIQASHSDRQKASEEMMAYYREHNINPVGSCLPLLAQMPVFLILYQVVRGLTRRVDGTFDPKYLSEDSAMRAALSGTDEMLFLGIDLSRTAQDVLASNFVDALPYLLSIALVAVTSYVQQKQVSGRNPSSEMAPQQRMLLRVMPVFFAFISFTFPAALVLYFLVSNLFRVGQQAYISKKLYGVGAGLFGGGGSSSTNGGGSSSFDGDGSGGEAAAGGGLMDKLRSLQESSEPDATPNGETEGKNGSGRDKPAEDTKSNSTKARRDKTPGQSPGSRAKKAKGPSSRPQNGSGAPNKAGMNGRRGKPGKSKGTATNGAKSLSSRANGTSSKDRSSEGAARGVDPRPRKKKRR